MTTSPHTRCIAFAGSNCIASGELRQVAPLVKQVVDRGEPGQVLIFDETTSELIDLDWRVSPEAESEEAETRKPGRPKLGVIPREVTLLPRHWEWLNSQPGGASVALRKLVEEARRVHASKDKRRRAQEVTYRFLSAMAGNRPGFEEAARALFAGDPARFHHYLTAWPPGIRDHAAKLAREAFEEQPASAAKRPAGSG